jgi:hypothetical protein
MVVECNDSVFTKIALLNMIGLYGGVRLNMHPPSLLIIAPPFTNHTPGSDAALGARFRPENCVKIVT